jgi:hypothetical protein
MLKKKEPVDPQDDDISWSLVFDTVNLWFQFTNWYNQQQ